MTAFETGAYVCIVVLFGVTMWTIQWTHNDLHRHVLQETGYLRDLVRDLHRELTARVPMPNCGKAFLVDGKPYHCNLKKNHEGACNAVA